MSEAAHELYLFDDCGQHVLLDPLVVAAHIRGKGHSVVKTNQYTDRQINHIVSVDSTYDDSSAFFCVD